MTELPDSRVTVFLDILGFREFIRECKVEPERYLALQRAFSGFGETKAALESNVLRPGGLQFTSFSDSIVVSAPLSGFRDRKVQLEWCYLVTELGTLVLRLLEEGLLCRGGITTGWLHHRNNVLFGEGLIAAYNLESSYARYPRILVSSELAKRFGDGLLLRDNDGYWLLSIFSFAANDAHLVEVGRALQVLVEAEAKRTTRRPEVLAKITWLASLYNRTVREDVFQVIIPEVTPW